MKMIEARLWEQYKADPKVFAMVIEDFVGSEDVGPHKIKMKKGKEFNNEI